MTFQIHQRFGDELLNKLRDDFQFMTESMMKKTMQHANKQLQDTLMNYFLENYVSAILKKHLGKTTNRSVRELLDQNLLKDYPKYMALLMKFEDKIEEIGLTETYEKMLTGLILDQRDYSPENADQWKTHTRKRMLSLMLYCHLKLKGESDLYSNFFELWKLVYPTNPLPQRVARNKPSAKQQTNMQGGCASDNSLDFPNPASEQTLLKRKYTKSSSLLAKEPKEVQKKRKLDEKISSQSSSSEILDQNTTIPLKKEDVNVAMPPMYMNPWAFNQQSFWTQPQINPFMYNNQMMIILPANMFGMFNPMYPQQQQTPQQQQQQQPPQSLYPNMLIPQQ